MPMSRRDSNPQSQQASNLRPRDHWHRQDIRYTGLYFRDLPQSLHPHTVRLGQHRSPTTAFSSRSKSVTWGRTGNENKIRQNKYWSTKQNANRRKHNFCTPISDQQWYNDHTINMYVSWITNKPSMKTETKSRSFLTLSRKRSLCRLVTNNSFVPRQLTLVTEYATGVRSLTTPQRTVIIITELTGRLITVISTPHQYSTILTKSRFHAYRLITRSIINSKENWRISSSDRVCVCVCVCVYDRNSRCVFAA